MSTHKPEKLLSLWQREELTSDMAIGHILQNLAVHQAALKRLTLLVTQLSAQTTGLLAQVGSASGSIQPTTQQRIRKTTD